MTLSVDRCRLLGDARLGGRDYANALGRGPLSLRWDTDGVHFRRGGEAVLDLEPRAVAGAGVAAGPRGVSLAWPPLIALLRRREPSSLLAVRLHTGDRWLLRVEGVEAGDLRDALTELGIDDETTR